MEIRLGQDWPAIAHLNYWKEREVDEYLMNLLADYENFQHVTFMDRWGVEPTRIQKLMGKWISGAIDPETEQHLRGVMAFRSATKTAIASNVCAWLTLLDPRISVKVVSGGDKLAKAITKECRAWYDSSETLRELLHPSLNKNTAAMQDNVEGFNVPGNPGGKDNTFCAVPIMGNITGTRAHIVLMDDIEHPDLCGTADKREKLKARDSEANNILFDKNASKASKIMYDGFTPLMLYLGTPHHEESIYTHKETHGYTFRIWPARYPNEEYEKTIGSRLCPELRKDLENDPELSEGYGLDLTQGRVIDIVRQSEDKCCQDERVNGKSGFAKQFMLDVSMQNVDKYPLKVSDLIVADLDKDMARGQYMSERAPEFELKHIQCVGLPGDRFYRPSWMSDDVHPYENMIMTIDTSGRGPDETTYSIGGTLNGMIFCLKNRGLAGAGGNGYSDEVLMEIVNAAKYFNVKLIVVESNYGDGMFTKLLTPLVQKHYPCAIEERRASGQKEVRIIETLEPVLSARKLIMNKEVIEQDITTLPQAAIESQRMSYSLIHQLARITRDRNSLGHDDRLDSLELLVRELSDALGIDNKKAADSKLSKFYKQMKTGGMFAGRTGKMGIAKTKKKSSFF